MSPDRAAWLQEEAKEDAYWADEERYEALNLPPAPLGTQAGTLPPTTRVYLWDDVVTLMLAARTTEPEPWLTRGDDDGEPA